MQSFDNIFWLIYWCLMPHLQYFRHIMAGTYMVLTKINSKVKILSTIMGGFVYLQIKLKTLKISFWNKPSLIFPHSYKMCWICYSSKRPHKYNTEYFIMCMYFKNFVKFSNQGHLTYIFSKSSTSYYMLRPIHLTEGAKIEVK